MISARRTVPLAYPFHERAGHLAAVVLMRMALAVSAHAAFPRVGRVHFAQHT
jgi:hypothetical protein